MNSAIFKSLIAASLIVLAVGCGKKGGGSSNNPINGFPVGTNPYLSESSKVLQNELSSWMAQAEPSVLRTFGRVTSKLSPGTATTCPGEIKRFLGIDWCVVKTSSTTTVTNGDEVIYLVGANSTMGYVQPNYCVRASNGYCTVGTETTYPGKNANPKLQEVFTARNNSLFLLSVTKTGTVYQVVYASNSIEQIPSVIYKIDTSVHSMYNPVEIVDLKATQPTQEYIKFY